MALIKGFNDLASVNPALAEEWNYEKNGTLTPDQVTEMSGKKVWWKCNHGHEWESIIANRSKGNGCPFCAGKKVLKGFNDLETMNPTLAEEWNYEKNGTLTPDMVMQKSGKKVWWKCKFGHEWEATLLSRSGGTGCPFCAGQKQTSFAEQSIAFYLSKVLTVKQRWIGMGKEIDIYLPELRVGIEYNGEYWHRNRTRKDEIKRNFFARRNIKIIYVLESDKEYVGEWFIEHKCNNRKSLNWAIKEIFNYLKLPVPYIDIEADSINIMNRYLLLSLENSVSKKNPTLAEEWNYEKNGTLTPDQVTAGSNKKVWWKCKFGHEWEATVANRSKGHGCPYCAGQRAIKGVNDLWVGSQTFAEEWNYEKNGTLTPDMIMEKSGKKVWWKCKHGHEWEATVANRSSGRGCPYCAGSKVLRGFNDLTIVNPTLAEEWNYEQNGTLTPDQVTAGSNKKVWWKCKFGHEWEATVADRSKGHGCPFCAGKKVLKGFNDLETMNPTLAEEWNYEKNGTLTPDQVIAGSNKKVWWKCKHGHEWEAMIGSRSKGRGCPVCAGQKVTKGFNDLITVNPTLAEEWNYEKNGTLTPDQVTAGSNKKVWWKCKFGHEWEAMIGSRSKGHGCPFCSGRRK